jgi:hypothetical protein
LRNTLRALTPIEEGEYVIMKKLVSFVLGAVMLFGAATLGLPSASANAKDKHDKNYWKHHRKHHRRHRMHRMVRHP